MGDGWSEWRYLRQARGARAKFVFGCVTVLPRADVSSCLPNWGIVTLELLTFIISYEPINSQEIRDTASLHAQVCAGSLGYLVGSYLWAAGA